MLFFQVRVHGCVALFNSCINRSEHSFSFAFVFSFFHLLFSHNIHRRHLRFPYIAFWPLSAASPFSVSASLLYSRSPLLTYNFPAATQACSHPTLRPCYERSHRDCPENNKTTNSAIDCHLVAFTSLPSTSSPVDSRLGVIDSPSWPTIQD